MNKFLCPCTFWCHEAIWDLLKSRFSLLIRLLMSRKTSEQWNAIVFGNMNFSVQAVIIFHFFNNYSLRNKKLHNIIFYNFFLNVLGQNRLPFKFSNRLTVYRTGELILKMWCPSLGILVASGLCALSRRWTLLNDEYRNKTDVPKLLVLKVS